MMKFIIGKKLDMTQVWQGEKVVAVTRIEAGPCLIAQVKNEDKDGYNAVQLGFGKRKEKNIKKPQKGHLKKLKINLRYLKEFKTDDKDLKVGDMIDVSAFSSGDTIDVIGVSKGRGFQGVVKRHGFHGHNKTHGTKDQVRMPGSIGATGPAHVFKGMRMPGRMGGDRATVKNLEIIEVDKDNNILLVKG
ncbi:MAG: 50S ribosomal protein L3, partial [Patescibacteria group bacterium]|nr:50S ribosomal protein L3 [Patescibacteria group bacterium]